MRSTARRSWKSDASKRGCSQMSYYAACALIKLPVMSDYPAIEEMYYPLCSSSPAHLPLMKGLSKKKGSSIVLIVSNYN